MKILSLLLIVGAFIMGMKDGGDVTGAVVLLMVLAPMLFERKKVSKCTTRNARTAEHR